MNSNKIYIYFGTQLQSGTEAKSTGNLFTFSSLFGTKAKSITDTQRKCNRSNTWARITLRSRSYIRDRNQIQYGNHIRYPKEMRDRNKNSDPKETSESNLMQKKNEMQNHSNILNGIETSRFQAFLRCARKALYIRSCAERECSERVWTKVF